MEITGVKNVEADWIMLRCKSVRKAQRFVIAGDQSELYVVAFDGMASVSW